MIMGANTLLAGYHRPSELLDGVDPYEPIGSTSTYEFQPFRPDIIDGGLPASRNSVIRGRFAGFPRAII
jgi:hypothetical protein